MRKRKEEKDSRTRLRNSWSNKFSHSEMKATQEATRLRITSRSMEKSCESTLDTKIDPNSVVDKFVVLTYSGAYRLGFVSACLYNGAYLVTFHGDTQSSEVHLIPGLYRIVNLVGRYVSVQWPKDGKNYIALVIGSHKTSVGNLYKLYYIEDGSIEIVNLTERYWEFEYISKIERDELLGKRLFVMWKDVYKFNLKEKKISEELFGVGKTQIPYEAFVVKRIDVNIYKIVYPSDDSIESFKFDNSDSSWAYISLDANRVEGLALMTWAENFKK